MENIFEKAEAHSDASSYMNPANPVVFVLVSVLLEQQKEIEQLKEEI